MTGTQTQLMPIFQWRVAAFQELNPSRFSKGKEELLVRSSLAAQQVLLEAGRSLGYTPTLMREAQMAHVLVKAYKDHRLSPKDSGRSILILELVSAFLRDLSDGVVDKNGDVIGDINQSFVMRIGYNGEPNEEFKKAKQTIARATQTFGKKGASSILKPRGKGSR